MHVKNELLYVPIKIEPSVMIEKSPIKIGDLSRLYTIIVSVIDKALSGRRWLQGNFYNCP